MLWVIFTCSHACKLRAVFDTYDWFRSRYNIQYEEWTTMRVVCLVWCTLSKSLVRNWQLFFLLRSRQTHSISRIRDHTKNNRWIFMESRHHMCFTRDAALYHATPTLLPCLFSAVALCNSLSVHVTRIIYMFLWVRVRSTRTYLNSLFSTIFCVNSSRAGSVVHCGARISWQNTQTQIQAHSITSALFISAWVAPMERQLGKFKTTQKSTSAMHPS